MKSGLALAAAFCSALVAVPMASAQDHVDPAVAPLAAGAGESPKPQQPPTSAAAATIWKSSIQSDSGKDPWAISRCSDDTGTGMVNGVGMGGGVTKLKKLQTPFWGRNEPIGDLTIQIDMSEKVCVSEQINLVVPNKQEILVKVTSPNPDVGTCTATETTAPVTPPDIGALLAKFLGGGPAFAGAHNEVPVRPVIASKGFKIPPISNSKATVTISCKGNAPDTSPDLLTSPAKTIIVTYQNMPPVSASVGSIVSLLGKKTYGIDTTIGSVTSGGAVTSIYTVGVTSTSTVQFVPIAFLNVYAVGNRNTHLDLQAGMGINPNGSKTNVEYFFGPALAWKGLYISPGLHLAQAQYLTNGYTVGETVSSQSFSVPTAYHTTLRFGFAISYSPKLPSSSGPAPSGQGN